MKYSSEFIEGAEYFRDGSEFSEKKSCKLKLLVKRIFSDDPMEDDYEKPIVWEKTLFINIDNFDAHPDVYMHDKYSNKRPIDI